MHYLLEKSTEWFDMESMWSDFGYTVIRIAAILVVGRILIWILHKSVNRIVIDRASKRPPNQARRMTTVGKLMKNVTSYVIYFIAGMLTLSEIGLDLGPLLAGAGVVGIAIGFGAQSLVKDILTGFFIIMEDQFAVGDVIQTGTFKGTVEMIGLRTTRIQSWTGEIHIVPNSTIGAVTNFSVSNSLAVLDVSLAYDADIEHATRIITETMHELKSENVVKEPEVLGIVSLESSAVTIRIIAECLPNTQTTVARLMNKVVKEAFDHHGIKMPYPKIVTFKNSIEGA
ncbi:mechanosensitive ion channel family protein [Paenibacillus sp. HB172176]|uniref:mechanosensitive ion channel family protein n=1 Tax=Paenibacillus sp. HB172176 TaxID=2493690 RepID=UPI001F1160A6|nr:mechanosensitive ion channel family protein [Paenibacillus sp. HB172176]